MGDWSNAALQTVFWNCANILRREAKLCDIVLYVQNRRGFMVGHPAHKILLISTSKYFKLLFEREDLRNFCHFPHLNEEGLVSVLDIIYGRELHENTNLEDALLAARFLQVDIAIETLEKKQKKKQSQKSNQFTNSENISRSGSTSSDLDKSYTLSVAAAQDTAEVRLFRNVKNTESESTKTESKKRKISSTDKEQQQQDSQMTDSEMSPSQGEPVSIKIEPDIDLTEEGDSSFNVSLPQISFVQGGDDVVDDDNGQTFMYPTEPGSADTSFDSSSMGFSSQMMDPNVNFMSANNSDGSTGFQGENMTGYHADVNRRSTQPASSRRVYKRNTVDSRLLNCDICGQVISRNSMYKHKRMHTGIKPFKCHACGKFFTEVGNLYKHKRQQHGDYNVFTCDICGLGFDSSMEFKSHKNKCLRARKSSLKEEKD